MAAKEANSHFDKMITDFITDCNNMMDMLGTNYNRGLESIYKNYVDLQSQYAKGHYQMLQQAQKANSEMKESMAKNFIALKSNLLQLHDSTLKQSKDVFDKGLASFKTQCEDVIKKFPTVQPRLYEEALKSLKESQIKNEAGVIKCYKEMLAGLEKSYEDSVKQMKFPDFKEPTVPIVNIRRLTITSTNAPAVGEVAVAGPSAAPKAKK